MSDDYEMMGFIRAYDAALFQISRFTNPSPEVPELLFESQFFMYRERRCSNNGPVSFHTSFEGMFRAAYVKSYTCL